MTAVKADRIALPGGWYFQQLNPPHGILYALRTPKGQGFGINGTGMSVGRPVVQAFAAAMSTPTPGRAAEPDTMGEVERLARSFGSQLLVVMACGMRDNAVWVEARPELDALLSAVRTIVTERDDARTRTETAEAQLATLRAALKPFAAVAVNDIGQDEGDLDYFRPAAGHNRAPRLTVGDLRRAAHLSNPKADQ